MKNKDIYVQNDDLTNGRVATGILYSRDTDIKKGDTIKVEMQNIDPVYINIGLI